MELAKELNLGLDSFIIIDDNPVECAEIRASLPEVLTLRLPSEDAEIPGFLRHVWAFDRLKVTAEDRQRTQMYRQTVERDRFEAQASSIGDFLASLQLKIDIAAPADDEWQRVAQLTQRTNQFNFTTIRRSEAEMRRLNESGLECVRVRVTDRFGDYGIVGVMIFGPAEEALRIDTMLLSCRVLGRGIEHAMVARLGQLACERVLASVTAQFVPTARNQPAHNFLESIGAADRHEVENGISYSFAAEQLSQLQYVPGSSEKAALELARFGKRNVAADETAHPIRRDKSALYMRIASELNTVEAIERSTEAAAIAARPDLDKPLVGPRTSRERELAKIWARLLHLDRVGIRDDFAALGGTSLIAAQLFAEIENRFGARLPMTAILDAPTIEQLATRLEGGGHESLKLLKPGMEGAPALFLIHDGDGETLLYMNLARRLPEEVAVYGIEPYRNGRSAILHSRVPDMAAYYAGQIRRVRPEGPYFLGGMCAGGTIAFEMACQLRAQGLPVGMVALIDSAYPHAQRKAGLIAQRRGARFFQVLREGDRQQGPMLWRLTRRMLLAGRKVRNLAVYEVTSRFRRFSNKIRFRKFRSAVDQCQALPWYLEGLTVRTVYEFAERDYRPAGRLDAPVVLLRATEGKGANEPFINLFEDPLLGWAPYVLGELEVIEVPGGHSSMLQEPNVAALAKCICAFIGRSDVVAAAS
jgi:FkbH-like protein